MTTMSQTPKSFDPTQVLQPDHLLRGAEVQARTQVGKTKRNELIRKGEFPQPIKVCGGRTNFWLASEIDLWLQKQVSQHRALLAAIASDPLNGWLNKAVNRIKDAPQHKELRNG